MSKYLNIGEFAQLEVLAQHGSFKDTNHVVTKILEATGGCRETLEREKEL
jgi:hypothetical protein